MSFSSVQRRIIESRDEPLRRAEKRWLETGDPEDYQRFLNSKRRYGEPLDVIHLQAYYSGTFGPTLSLTRLDIRKLRRLAGLSNFSRNSPGLGFDDGLAIEVSVSYRGERGRLVVDDYNVWDLDKIIVGSVSRWSESRADVFEVPVLDVKIIPHPRPNPMSKFVVNDGKIALRPK